MLDVLEAAHVVTAENVQLTNIYLLVSDALHQQLADNVALFGGGLTTPDNRIFVISAEDRTFVISADDRTFVIAAEDRIFSIS